MRRRVKLILSSALGLTILAGLIAYVGVGELVSAIRSADPRFIALSFGSYAAFFVLRGIRWSRLLAPIRRGIPATETTLLMALSWLINTYVPMKAGDVARAALLNRRHRIGFMQSASTVAVERTLDIAGLAFLASLGLFLIPVGMDLPTWFERGLQVAWVLPILLLGLLWWSVRRQDGFLRVCDACFCWLPTAGREKLVGLAESFLKGSESLAERPRMLVSVLPLTVLQSLAQAGVFVFLFLAFEPTAPVAILLAGVPFFLLSFIVALTPGNVGTYEAAFTAVFTALGLPASVVIPVAVLTHVSTTAFVTILGALALPALGLRPRSLRNPPAEPPEAHGLEAKGVET